MTINSLSPIPDISRAAASSAVTTPRFTRFGHEDRRSEGFDGRRFDGGVTAPAVSLSGKGSQRAHPYGFPLTTRKGYVKIAFSNDPYRIFVIGIEDYGGFRQLSPRHDLRPTGIDELPFELVLQEKPKHMRQAFDIAQEWVRVALDGQPTVRRSN